MYIVLIVFKILAYLLFKETDAFDVCFVGSCIRSTTMKQYGQYAQRHRRRVSRSPEQLELRTIVLLFMSNSVNKVMAK